DLPLGQRIPAECFRRESRRGLWQLTSIQAKNLWRSNKNWLHTGVGRIWPRACSSTEVSRSRADGFLCERPASRVFTRIQNRGLKCPLLPLATASYNRRLHRPCKIAFSRSRRNSSNLARIFRPAISHRRGRTSPHSHRISRTARNPLQRRPEALR